MLESPNLPNNAPNGTMASFGSDANLYIRFYDDAIKNEFRSGEEGHDVYDQFAFIEVMNPGSKNKVIEKVAVLGDKDQWNEFRSESGSPSWINRFPKQWEQFKKQQVQVLNGIPVNECPFFSKAYALNLKSQNILTLEQIRDLPDTAVEVLGLGGRATRDKVIAFLNRAVDASEITKLFSKIEKLEADNKVMKEQLSQKGEPISDSPPSQRAKKLNLAS